MKKYKVFIISLIHFLISFLTDRVFIDFNNFNLMNYIICKIVLYIILFLLWKYLFKLLENKNRKQYIKTFLIYFIPMIIIFLLIYPGIWYSDDFNFLNYAKNVEFLYYLNYLTSVYYSVSLMIIPYAFAPIIIQIVILGIVISYIITKVNEKAKTKLAYLMYIPFFLPMTIYYTLYCNRPIIYGIFYLLFIAVLFFDKKINNKKMFSLTFLIAVLAFWRSEGIYLILLGPLLVILIYKLKKKDIIKVFLYTITLFLLLNIPQYLHTSYNNSTYELDRYLPSIVNPLSYMITQKIDYEGYDKDLKNISKVLDIESMIKYNSLHDVFCIWKEDGCVKSYSKEEYQIFLKSYANIIMNNKLLFIKSKLLTFYYTLGIENNTYDSCELLQNINNENIYKFLNNYKFTHPINDKLRTNIIRILEGRNIKTHEPIKIYNYLNNLFIPGLFLTIYSIYKLIKKDYKMFLMSFILLVHSGLIMINAPANYFMYYYPVYLVGYFMIFNSIIFTIERKKK